MGGTIKKGPKHKKPKDKIVLPINSKKRAERIHATRRLEERYNIQYTNELRLCLVNKIQTNEYLSHKKQTGRKTIFEIIYNNTCYKLVYDKKRKEIITFL